jgi:putative membrane protein insertion efficiency factor
MKLINKFLILLIKFYKYFISPYFFSNCRYSPTCSEYFIDCLKLNGSLKGTFLGFKRILRCHPIKFLGGKSGFDPAPKLNKEIK